MQLNENYKMKSEVLLVSVAASRSRAALLEKRPCMCLQKKGCIVLVELTSQRKVARYLTVDMSSMENDLLAHMVHWKWALRHSHILLAKTHFDTN